MTNERAINVIKDIKNYYNDKSEYYEDGYIGFDKEDNEAIDLAIKALEQQPCEDCISRKAVLDLVADYDLSMGQVVKGIHALPSVTPTNEDISEAYIKGYDYGVKDWFKSKTQPCEDCVSRADVKEQMLKYGFNAPDMTVTEFVEDCLQPVTPQPKMGRWIADVDRWGDIVTTVNGYRCSECNTFDTDKDNYCPNCGAKMEVEE